MLNLHPLLILQIDGKLTYTAPSVYIIIRYAIQKLLFDIQIPKDMLPHHQNLEQRQHFTRLYTGGVEFPLRYGCHWKCSYSQLKQMRIQIVNTFFIYDPLRLRGNEKIIIKFQKWNRLNEPENLTLNSQKQNQLRCIPHHIVRIRECVCIEVFVIYLIPLQWINWIIIIIKPKHYEKKMKIHYILVHFRPSHNKRYPGPSDGSRIAIFPAVELITLPFCDNYVQVLITICSVGWAELGAKNFQ